MEAGYPKNMRNWRGVPSYIDGVITWKDGTQMMFIFQWFVILLLGITYFFKEDRYWRFDDYMVITDSEIPLKIGPHWFDC